MKKDLTLPVPVYTVDAFTDTPFRGNPAAVCFLSDNRSDAWMQKVAAEMNLSETAFFRPLEQGGYQLRWFTPTTEVDLCGHATLATAHVIWATDMSDPAETLEFHTRSGILRATFKAGMISLDFPSILMAETALPEGLEAALGTKIDRYLAQGSMGLAVLKDESAVRGVQPVFERLVEVDVQGIIVTAKADKGSPFDFVSRFFAPAIGLNEDPVTGSAHCALATYWGKTLGKPSMLGFQASQRGGQVAVNWAAANPSRVMLQGKAVIVLQGVLSVDANRA